MEGTQAVAQTVSPAKLAHLVLLTRDLPRLRDWYGTVLQATVTVEDPMLAFLSYDDEHHRIAFVGMPDLPPRTAGPQVGLHHMAFTYRSLDDLLRTYERLKRLGIEPYWPIHHGVTISMYYRDPDGNNVELQVDAFGSMEEAKAYMRSDSFRNNPIGVIYDPDELVRRHRAGEPFASLAQRPPLPAGKTPVDMLRL
jgi:catechol-2,3-dioxygenase